MTTVAVVGAGSWGTTLADLLARKGLEVRLWAYEEDVATAIRNTHENPIYLPSHALHRGVTASHDLSTVVRGAGHIVWAVPSHASRAVLESGAAAMAPDVCLTCATKGIQADTLQLMNGVVSDVLPQARFVALSGPSFAEEVHAGQPTAVVAASTDAEAAAAVQQLMSTAYFRVYTLADVTGVELGGSLKNTIAIAAGILDGLGLGNNPRAALLTRGLAEMARLGVALGADTQTFSGLAGMGDLILTCTGALSRNRQLGQALARGATLAEYRASHRQVAEGVNTAMAASRLAEQHGVEMPITQQVAAVLFEGISARDAIQSLMERTLKAERWK